MKKNIKHIEKNKNNKTGVSLNLIIGSKAHDRICKTIEQCSSSNSKEDSLKNNIGSNKIDKLSKVNRLLIYSCG